MLHSDGAVHINNVVDGASVATLAGAAAVVVCVTDRRAACQAVQGEVHEALAGVFPYNLYAKSGAVRHACISTNRATAWQASLDLYDLTDVCTSVAVPAPIELAPVVARKTLQDILAKHRCIKV